MKKFIFYAIFLLLFSAAFQMNNLGQERQTIPLLELTSSFESFEQKADNRTDNLLFKIMQFRAPYGGAYLETSLAKSGRAFSARFMPYAVQNSRRAELNSVQVEQLKQKLTALIENFSPDVSSPINKEIYTAFVVANGADYSRYNFIGEIPAPLQDILALLKTEFEKVQAKEYEDFLATEKILKEKYGDWLNTPGIIRPAASGFKSLTNHRKILLYLKGRLQPVNNEKPPEIPLYYALVSYLSGRTIGGAGGGRSSDPVSANGITWSVARPDEADTKENQRILQIEYHAINGTIRIARKIYKLSDGNLFVIKIAPDWKAQVKQLKIRLRQSITEADALSYFKSQFRDETLELPK